MRTAVDSSVLLDVFGSDPRFGVRSREALRRAYDEGALVACDVVWAEVRAHFDTETAFLRAATLIGLRFEPLSADAAALAGRLWRERRRAGHRRSQRVVSDFLIGAHAALQADRLLTRDRGFFRRYYRTPVIDPSKA